GAVEQHPHPAHRAVVRLLESELDFLLDVASGARTRAPRAAPGATRPLVFGVHRAAKEGLKEVGERIAVSEHLLHLFFGHRAVAAAGSLIERPGAAGEALAALEAAAGRTACLLVHPP